MANINKVALLNNGKVVGAGRNKDNSNLAPIEATTTASRSYQVGDYLMLQGEFYKVISAIAIGDTLTVGTNIQSTTVGNEIVDIKDDVSAIEDRISANAISDDTKITLSYGTEYVTLVDGYFRIVCNSGGDYWTTGYINGVGLLQTTAVSGQTASGVNAVFVRKGSKIKYSGTSSASTIAYFYPLS